MIRAALLVLALSAPAHAGGAMPCFDAETMALGADFDQTVIAAVTVDRVVLDGAGTRSQQLVVDATLLWSAPPRDSLPQMVVYQSDPAWLAPGPYVLLLGETAGPPAAYMVLARSPAADPVAAAQACVP